MATGLFTSLFNALSDPKSYYAMQKEVNLKAVAQTFFNSLAGKTVFEAVVLPQDIGQSVIYDGQRALRVRIPEIHDLIIPEPCEFEDVGIRKRLLSLHPVAYPDNNNPNIDLADAEPDSNNSDMRVVECFFKDGPQSSGRLRGLTYRPKTFRNAGARGINFACLFGDKSPGPSELFKNGGYNENSNTGETFPDGTPVKSKFGGKHAIEKIEKRLKPQEGIIQGIGAPSAAANVIKEINWWKDRNEKDVMEKGKTNKNHPVYKRIQLYNYYGVEDRKRENGEKYRKLEEYWPNYEEDEKLLKRGVGGSSTEGTGDSVTGIMHWSATSVSFCMRGLGFPARYGHSAYASNIAWGKSKGWKAFSLIRHKIVPKIGDVVVKPAGHGRKSTTYTASHGDIIYKIDSEYAYTAGGNLGSRGQFKESSHKIKLAADGTVANSDPYIIILKKME